MESVTTSFFRALHWLVISFFALYLKIKVWWIRPRDRVSLKELISFKENKHFKKLPVHLAFILNYNDKIVINNEDLAKLICWAIILEIPYISVHDPDGILKQKSRELINLIQFKFFEQEYSGSEADILEDQQNNECKITFKDKIIRLKFLCRLDGKEQLAEVVKGLVKEKSISQNNNEPVEITHPKEITKELKKRWDFPEPDYAIVCSQIYSVHGYPPWQLRYTEVDKLIDPSYVTIEAFYVSLCKYCKIEQRFGA